MELRDLRHAKLDVPDAVVLESRLDRGGDVRCSQDDPAVRDQPGVFQELAHVLSKTLWRLSSRPHCTCSVLKEGSLQSSPCNVLLNGRAPKAGSTKSCSWNRSNTSRLSWAALGIRRADLEQPGHPGCTAHRLRDQDGFRALRHPVHRVSMTEIGSSMTAWSARSAARGRSTTTSRRSSVRGPGATRGPHPEGRHMHSRLTGMIVAGRRLLTRCVPVQRLRQEDLLVL